MSIYLAAIIEAGVAAEYFEIKHGFPSQSADRP